MSLLQRAFLYNIRKKGKSSILFLILFLMALTVLVGLAIYRGTNQGIQKLRESMGGSFKTEAIYSKDDLSVWQSSPQGGSMRYIGPKVDEKLMKEIMSFDGIEKYNAVYSWELYADDLELFDGLFVYANKIAQEKESGSEMWEKISSFIGNSRTEENDYFRTGAFELVDGTHIGEGDLYKVLISEKLAKYNKLKLGDSFTVSLREGTGSQKDNPYKLLCPPFDLQIAGIFKVNSGLGASEMVPESSISDNIMFTSIDFSEKIVSYLEENNPAYDYCTFFVEDPKELLDIIDRVKEKEIVSTRYFSIQEDDATYQASAGPLKNINRILYIFIGTVLGTCSILLFLILTMWIKGRTRETGILFSIGITKKNIISQYILECMMIAILAFSLSFVISNNLAYRVGNFALDKLSPKQVDTIKQVTKEDITSEYGQAQVMDQKEVLKPETGSNTPESLDIKVEVGEFFVSVFIVTGLICGSVYWSVSKELRRNPKDILGNH